MRTKYMNNKKEHGLIKFLFLRNIKIILVTFLLSIFISILYDIYATWIVKNILEKILSGKGEALLDYVIGFIAIFIGVAVINIILKYIFIILKKRGIIVVEDKMLQEYYDCQKKKDSSKYLAVIQNSVPNLVQGFFDFVYNSEQIVIRSIIVIIYGTYISSVCVILCIAIAMFFMFFLKRFHNKIPAHSKSVEKSFNSVYENIWDLVSNVEILRTLNDKKVYARLENCMYKCENEQIENAKLSNMARILSRLSSMGIVLIVGMYGGILSISGNFEIFNIIILITILPTLSDNLFKFPEIAASYKKIKGIESNINSVRILKECLKDNEGLPFTDKIREINIIGLNLCVGDRKEIRVDKIGFRAGNLIGISGESGIGKTYFIQVLLKYNQGYKGDIKINGIGLDRFITESYWKEICYLTQNPVILPKFSIRDNIILNEEYDRERYREAVKSCDLNKYIQSRRDGDLYILSGDKLSAGEIQKICLARVFYTNKSLCILDEATSALAPATEAAITGRLKCHAAQTGKIIIFITHSNTAIQNCDLAYRMEYNKLGKISLIGESI